MTFCYDIKCDWWRRCMWCDMKDLCINEYGERADRDSNHCRMLVYHYSKCLECIPIEESM